MSLDEQLPIANWPTESGEFKVVQLDVDGQPHLRFIEDEWKRHADILMMLFDELAIPYHTLKRSGNLEIPVLQGERYKVHGMGKARVDVKHRRASFYGTSFDYGIGIDATHLASVKPLLQDWVIWGE